MKKTLFLLMAEGDFSLAQAASVLVEVYGNGAERPGMNLYKSNSKDELQLQDASENGTPYTLKIVKNGGNFFNSNVTAATSGKGDPAYGAYFQNGAAMTDLVNTLGSFDYEAMSTFMNPGAGGSTTSSIQLGGSTAWDTITFYMFVSSVAAAPGATAVTGGTGSFEYAAMDGTGFSTSPSFANNKLTLVTWTGTATSDTLDFRIGGAESRGGCHGVFRRSRTVCGFPEGAWHGRVDGASAQSLIFPYRMSFTRY
ncbi:hypothetical protein [Akkermansia sp.]|uniref:hypothetical protein n=1 Tax=Akkermansia sp. TaxID=1872421 RepID=UPI003AB563F1